MLSQVKIWISRTRVWNMPVSFWLKSMKIDPKHLKDASCVHVSVFLFLGNPFFRHELVHDARTEKKTLFFQFRNKLVQGEVVDHQSHSSKRLFYKRKKHFQHFDQENVGKRCSELSKLYNWYPSRRDCLVAVPSPFSAGEIFPQWQISAWSPLRPTRLNLCATVDSPVQNGIPDAPWPESYFSQVSHSHITRIGDHHRLTHLLLCLPGGIMIQVFCSLDFWPTCLSVCASLSIPPSVKTPMRATACQHCSFLTREKKFRKNRFPRFKRLKGFEVRTQKVLTLLTSQTVVELLEITLWCE